MQPQPQPTREELDRARSVVHAVSGAFAAKVVGQAGLQQSLLIGLFTGGHVLLESVPGLAKTTAARAVADAVQAKFRRIQCTPDLLPSDIIGTQIFDASKGVFHTQLGPVHANIVLLDEINRSSAKTQSAMLEAMEERQTSIAGEVYKIPEPFLVLATQNPVDQEGTYPLPEAQMDRFMFKEILTYPNPREEAEMVFRIDAGVYTNHRAAPVASLDDILYIRDVARRVYLDPAIVNYITQIVAVTRTPQQYLPANLARLIEYGASPRATIAFCKAARALALLSGRNHVLPDDVKALAHRVLRHRLILGFEAVAQNVTPEVLIDHVIQAVRTP
ncbi:AAA domain-containing protein [Mycobacterium sp. CBMA293]|nr:MULTISPECIES: AAA family ATPase [unclassified Mycolicibacterium]MUL44553.1 AAA domain-containing protein [Mycolicibacterium sp. CBMA 360]MUL59875.1 AAA domain-containing protein [Mycolicibacterium sp. CBMA 335]MUL68718.1 AAA domain-containing protein [Mycolicibacterium sp. CBMA 311]MUL93891.1 AAA domain-containing protein [Mycolicibacterium sp. CBMA 230]MUM12849.1 AAA domain-containing protein [Mycolicibacterium sp. CBMA 293]